MGQPEERYLTIVSIWQRSSTLACCNGWGDQCLFDCSFSLFRHQVNTLAIRGDYFERSRQSSFHLPQPPLFSVRLMFCRATSPTWILSFGLSRSLFFLLQTFSWLFLQKTTRHTIMCFFWCRDYVSIFGAIRHCFCLDSLICYIQWGGRIQLRF